VKEEQVLATKQTSDIIFVFFFLYIACCLELIIFFHIKILDCRDKELLILFPATKVSVI
jgi:hypothetical protein